MFSKFNNNQKQSYQLSSGVNDLSDKTNIVKGNFNHHHQTTNTNSNLNCMNSNEFANMDEEEDDVDSLNINFDDVNDQSDIDDYYNNCSTQGLNANNELNSFIMNKNENCLYDMSQHFNHFNSKLPNSLSQNQNKQMGNGKLNQCSYISSSSILESVISSEIDSNEVNYSLSNSSKPSNRNIHCVKEKIRRDRIKTSCNQLRKLIPNVSGFKTDMASLLETSVIWTQLINANVPEQYLNNIKAKLASLATLKNSNQLKSIQQIQTTTNPNIVNQKYKSNYEYLMNKSQQEPQQRHSELTSVNPNGNSSSLLTSLNVQQMEASSLDAASNLHSMSSSINQMKPNAWLPYSFQLNNESNNSQKILSNIAQSTGNHQLSSYNDLGFYDKLIKKSPSNTNYTYER